MDVVKVLFEGVVSGTPHIILIAGMYFLWREYQEIKAENRVLHEKLENVRQTVASTHALTLAQNDELSQIKAQTGENR